MDTKSLLIGLASFIAGGLLVSTAAVTFEKPESSMSAASSLRDKSGDAYDEEFINQMIVHHEGAVEMAKLSADRAKHDEIKQLSRAIIEAQEREIAEMKSWQAAWNYQTRPAHDNGAH